MLSTLAPAGLFSVLEDPLTPLAGGLSQQEKLPSALRVIKPAFVLPRLDEGSAPRGLLNLSQRREIASTSQGWLELGAVVDNPTSDLDVENAASTATQTAKDTIALDDLDFWSAAASFPSGVEQHDTNCVSQSGIQQPLIQQREFKTWSCPPLQSPKATPSSFISETSVSHLDALLPNMDEQNTAEYAQRQTVSSSNSLHLLLLSLLGTTETAALKWDNHKSSFIWDGRIQGLGCVQSRS